jgi:hypothetical protein
MTMHARTHAWQVDGEGVRVDDAASALRRSLAEQEATRRIVEEQALKPAQHVPRRDPLQNVYLSSPFVRR